MYGIPNGRLVGRCIPDSMFTRPAARNLWKLFAATSISRIHASDLSLSLSLPPSRSSRLSRSRTGRHPAGPRAPIVLPATCRNFHTATRMLSNKVGTEIIPRWLCSIYPGSYSTFSAPFHLLLSDVSRAWTACYFQDQAIVCTRGDRSFDDRRWRFEAVDVGLNCSRWVCMMAWHFRATEGSRNSRGRFVGMFLS